MALPESGFEVEVQGRTRGAYFRKVQSPASSRYHGIRGVGVLPQVSFDPDRQYVAPEGLDFYKTGPLDRPSVYMGGHAAGREMDVGLTWDRVYDSEGRATYTNRPEGTDGRNPLHRFIRTEVAGDPTLLDGTGAVVAGGKGAVEARLETLRPNFAFRPYWRTTGEPGDPWHTPRKDSPENVYFYPGDKFTMSVREIGGNQVRMDVSLVDGREPITFTQEFRQKGFGGTVGRSFKRVNSIDQFWVDERGQRRGREGMDVLSTRSTVTGGGWEKVYLLDSDGREIQALMGGECKEIRGGDVAPRYEEIFHCSGWTAEGGEFVDIVPPQDALLPGGVEGPARGGPLSL